MWADLCTLLGHQDLVDCERFATQAAGAANHRELAEILNETMRSRTADEWIEVLHDAGIACAPVNDFAEALDDPATVFSKPAPADSRMGAAAYTRWQ